MKILSIVTLFLFVSCKEVSNLRVSKPEAPVSNEITPPVIPPVIPPVVPPVVPPVLPPPPVLPDLTTYNWQAGAFAPHSTFAARSVKLNDGRVLFVGGNIVDGGGNSATMFYNDDDTWSMGPTLVYSRTGGFTATLMSDGKVIIIGGDDVGFSQRDEVEIFDPTNDSVSAVGPIGLGRTAHTTTVLSDGRVVVIGGLNSGDFNAYRRVDIYDPVADSWSLGSTMGFSRRDHTAIRITSDKILVVGGEAPGGPFDRDGGEVYDATNDTWTPVLNKMQSARLVPKINNFESGEFIVSGGVYVLPGFGLRSTQMTDIYDPVTNQFSAGPNLIRSRAEFATVERSDGVILWIGGFDYELSNSTIKAVDIYDPLTGTITVGPELNAAASNNHAFLLDNDNVVSFRNATTEILQP